MKIIGILNGPNLNHLGKREPEIYGSETLLDLENKLKEEAISLNCEIHFYQSNHEGELIDKIYEWVELGCDGIVFNPAGYTHTSIALRDAVSGSAIPTIEVHISNIHKRESFRHKSLLAPVAMGTIAGLGTRGYSLALQYLAAI
jgi:3-dehydroquinate dehydratase-2